MASGACPRMAMVFVVPTTVALALMAWMVLALEFFGLDLALPSCRWSDRSDWQDCNIGDDRL